MVIVSTTSPPPPPPPTPSLGLKSESLTHIDISKLSQTELLALSHCSDSAFDLRPTDDLVVPNIDRSLFNESAGGRRQTYSRLRFRPTTTPGHHRSRLPGLLPSHHPKSPPSSDPETKTIVHFLKQQLVQENRNTNSPPPPSSSSPQEPVISSHNEADIIHLDTDTQVGSNVQDMGIVVHSSEREGKRKRKRKPKSKLSENGVGIELEIVNRNGVAVDLTALANADDLYSAELRRRTVGLETEEGVLGFLRGLEGQWCSRRKKRKYVDASEFGDLLPMGWKLLLGLRRREGHVSVYCRRYISPTGQQFVSCKETASFLQSYFGSNGANRPMDQRTGGIEQAYRVASSNQHAVVINKGDDMKHDMISGSTVTSSSVSNAHEKEIILTGIDNLAEVQVRDLFECYKCNMTFDEKNAYLDHLLALHHGTTRRYRFGTSVGEGVIIKDGKYECQFCHKVFEERRSYNGHVGIHVRNYVRGSEEFPTPINVQKIIESPTENELLPRMSKMDALIEIAQNSILETSSAEPNNKPNGDFSTKDLKVEQTSAVNTDHELNSGFDPNEMEMEDCLVDRALDQDINQHTSKYAVQDGEMVKIDGALVVENNMQPLCSNTSEHPKLDDVEKCGNSELEIGFGNSHVSPIHDVVENTIGKIIEENIIQNGFTDSSMHLVQSIHCFPAFAAVSNKEGNDFFEVGHKLDNVTGFEELSFDEIEPLKYDIVDGKESPSLPDVSMDLVNNGMMEERFNSSARFESETVMLNMAGRRQVTTVCVWCRTEFSHAAIDLEDQSDSIGFMCPTCKAKISGHLDSSLSINFHGF